MIISEMTAQECRMHLAASRVGRLACVRDGMPYVVPISFVYEDGHIYSFSLIGHKVWAMRDILRFASKSTRFASPRSWWSVIAFGRYEELSEAGPRQNKRDHAWSLLQKRAPTGGNLAARRLTPRTRWPVRLTSSSASTSRRSLAVVPSSHRPSLSYDRAGRTSATSDLHLREWQGRAISRLWA